MFWLKQCVYLLSVCLQFSIIITIMKWIALKIKNLPIISLQIDRAIQVFETMISKLQASRKREQLIQLVQLKSQFQNRIAELDVFYKEHHLDEGIAIFHMLKIKLQRALFKMNQLTNDKSFNQMSFKDDSLSLFPENQIKILDQPLFTYYQSTAKKSNNKDDYFDFAKDAPKEEFSSFGGKVEKKNTLHDDFRQSKPNQLKNQSNMPNQSTKIKTQMINSSQKNIGITKASAISSKDLKKSDKKPPVSYKPAKFTKGPLQKVEQSRKIDKKPPSPEKSGDLLQTNFLQCLNNQSQLKFTIKMTKEEYRALLQMKKKILQQGKN